MASAHFFISLQVLFSLASCSLGLMSDYKTCGDPACERMMSRVRALKDHQAQDCRFLNFKKGDMIVVYHKLSGRRSDLWAGSIDKLFGYFPRDAVNVEEVFVDEKQEIRMETQKYDFYCIDKFGSVIESDSNEIDDQDDQDNQDDEDRQDNQEDQSAKSEQLGNSDSDDPVSKSSQTNYNIKSEEDTQATSKQDPETSETSGSSWIGSAVNGWFGGGEESHDGPQEETHAEESFKSRKLALDMDENQLGEEKQAETRSWIGDELTNVFGFGQKASDGDTNDLSEDIIENTENSPTTQSSSWLPMGIKDVLGFGGGDNPGEPEAEDKNEDSVLKDEPSQPSDSTEDSGQEDENVPNQGDQQEPSSFPEDNVDPPADADTKSEESGWYSSVYSRFTNLYGDAQDNSDVSDDGGGDSALEADTAPKLTQNTLRDTEGQDTGAGPGSMFSVDRLSTVFNGLKSRFQSDTAETEVQSEEEKPPEQTEPGKEAFVEQQIDYAEEHSAVDEIKPSSTGHLIREMPSLPDENLVSLSDEEAEIPEAKLADDVIQTPESSIGQTTAEQGQTDGEMEEEQDIYVEKVLTDISTDKTAGIVDFGTSEQTDSPIEKRLLHEEPLEIAGEVTDPSSDTAQPDFSTDQGLNAQSVLNSDKAVEMLAEEPGLKDAAKTVMGTTDEQKVDTSTTSEAAESQKNDANAHKGYKDSDENPNAGVFSTYLGYFSAQKDTQPKTDTDSSIASSIDANTHEQVQLDPKINEFSRLSSYTANVTDQERDEDSGDESVTVREKDSVDFSVDFTQQSSEPGETQEDRKHGIVPDVSKQEYSTLEKTADATLGQPESKVKESQGKIPSKHSTASQHHSDASTANREGSIDSTEDVATAEESAFLSENKHQGFEQGELIQNASEDANTLDRKHDDPVSIAEGANADHTASDASLDSTKGVATAEESAFLSENKHKKGFEQGELIQNASEDANTLDRKHDDPVSIAEDANVDHTAADTTLDRTLDFTISEESLSDDESQSYEQEEQIQNASEDANTLDREDDDPVSISEDANTDHTASEASVASTEDITTAEESDILSENKHQKGFEHREDIQNASEDANTLDREDDDPVSISEDANSDHTTYDASLDSTEDITTAEESAILSESKYHKGETIHNASHSDHVSIAEDANTAESDILSRHESQKGFEQGEPIHNASEDASTLVREQNNHVSIAEDAHTDHTASDASLDSTEDVATAEESRILSDNEHQTGFEGGEPIQHISENANDNFVVNNRDNLNVVDHNSSSILQRQDEDHQTSRESVGKMEQIYDTDLKPTPDPQLSKSNHKDYPNLQAHLSEESIQGLLEVFGGHNLSWLDKNLGQVGAGHGKDHKDLSRLTDFEQTLEHHLNMRARHEEEDETYAKVDALLSTLRKTFMPVITDGSVDKAPDPRPDQCVGEGCVSLNDQETPNSGPEPERDDRTESSSSTEDSESLVSVSEERNPSEHVAEENPVAEAVQMLDGETDSHSEEHTGPEEFVEPKERPHAGDLYRYAAFVGEVTSDTFTYVLKKSAHLKDVICEVVQSLPDDIRPGPDLYGLPWEVVLVTTMLGLFTVLLFSCRFIQSIKSRLYASKERRMGQKVAELLEEKCKVLETLSECKQKFKKLETALQNGGASAQASEKENLEAMSKKLEQSNAEMKSDLERLQEELENQSKFRKQQEEQLAELEETLKTMEEDAKERKSQLEQDKTTLKIHEMNTERLQKKLLSAKEESSMLLESKAQLVQEAEGWGERLSELEEEMRMCERSHAGMVEDCTNKDERIKSLTDCLLKMKDWDSEEESSVDGSSGATGSENGDTSDVHQKQKLQKLIHAAKMSADLKAMEEDKDRVFAKLADELKAKEDLQEGIEQLHQEKESLESESSKYTSEIQKLQQKLQIMTEMYQENELKLHRMLTVEEKERLQKEEKLTKAGKKINLAAEELNNYRQRAKELEEELDRTSQAYKNQIAAHEKKAHDNWLAARAADRDLADVKRENSVLRQRLTDYQFKLELMEKEPYAREAPGRPVFRGERSPYGQSPLGRPSSETRAFLSPPTLMDGPPRLSPQFPMVPGGRVSRGVVEPPAGGLECDRSGPHSDSGSASPSWEKERRGPGPLPGPPPPDPGMLYRRPPPGPFPMGPPPPRPPPPEAYYGDKPDFLGNSSGPGENESRDSLHSMHGDMRVPPDADLRMGPPLGPPMDPRDPHFPRRMPYGPPDYFLPRGPGVPPMGMRGPPPGMFPRPPLPHPMAYPPLRPPPDGFLPGPPLRPPPPDSFQPGPPPRPSPPGSEQPPEQPPSPHDVI